jgi:hypothetical protein
MWKLEEVSIYVGRNGPEKKGKNMKRMLEISRMGKSGSG